MVKSNPQHGASGESGLQGRSIGHEDGAPKNGINAFIKVTPECSLVPSALWGHRQKMPIHEPGSRPRHSQNLQMSSSCTCKPPELWETNFCCWHVIESVVFCYSSLNKWGHLVTEISHLLFFVWSCFMLHNALTILPLSFLKTLFLSFIPLSMHMFIYLFTNIFSYNLQKKFPLAQFSCTWNYRAGLGRVSGLWQH